MIKTRARATQTDLFSWSPAAKCTGNVAAGTQYLLPKEKRRGKMSPLKTYRKVVRSETEPHLTAAKLLPSVQPSRLV